MTDAHPPEEILINDRALNKLIRAITLSQGNFSLILARCNYGSLRDRVVQQLRAQCPIAIRELHLSPSIKTLYTTIQAELGDEQPQALMIFGLEQVAALDHLLISTNQVREEFRKQFSFPIVLWVHDNTLTRITQLMPDFKSWTGNAIRFEIAPTELAQSLQQPLAELLTAILAVGEGKFLKLADLHPWGADLGGELASALGDLPGGDRLPAMLQFWAGREVDLRGEKAKAKAYYEQSVAFWQAQRAEGLSSEDWASYGCGLFHLGLWWRQYATQHRAEYEAACLEAKHFFQESLAAFDRTDRPELAAKFINAWGEVLTQLEQWDELATVAQRAVQLHQKYPEPIRLAYAHSLLAEVAVQKQDWPTVQAQAELALRTNELPSTSAIDWSLDWAQRKNLYLFLLAQAQHHLNQSGAAIENLETAKANFQPQYDPTVYIRILGTLRSLYFEQGQYLQAFETKQEQRSIEQQYGLRAFVGAGRLQSRRQVINPALATTDAKAAVTQEIAASGRLLDVNRLLERIGRTDHKLTVIYGQSGVGKSSLVQAGLVPALKQRSIEARDVVPVLLQVYTDWAQNLGDRLAESLQEVRGLSLPLFLDSMAAFVTEIKKSDDKNLLTVLIFDQFEEFFFAYKDPAQRRPFFEFLRDCLNVPYVKVILSLREDYLHYLLECNRLTHLDVIDNNILDKKILYHLGNFSPEDGRAVIQSLTDACQFNLEPALMDELVRDLAGALNEVRPIELQVVGAQMQTEQVMTLAQYLADGPKERFVGRFLEEVVTDCGTNNEQFAKIILYLLTDDNLTRPLKTRAELEADLAIMPERLDLILNILVKSGLVFQVPGFPADRYQLVHDYLVPFVRQQQAAGLVAELEKEREQRKLTEEKLNQALKQQLKSARRGILTLAGLAVAIGGIAIAATVAGINLYIYNLVADTYRNQQQLDQLVAAIKASKTLKALPVAISEIRLPVIASINGVIANVSELNRLEGHAEAVTQVVFSPDGQLIASISEDKTAKVWKVDNGQLLTTLGDGQSKKITTVSFSADSQLIAYTGEDQNIRFWTVTGQQLRVLPTQGTVSSLSFSPDNNLLATSVGKEVILWNLSAGKVVRTLKEHTGAITSISFSPNGKVIAVADQDDMVKIWSLDDNKAIKSISNYGTIGIRFNSDGNLLIVTNKDQTIKYYALDGTLVKNVETRGESEYVAAAALSPDSKLMAFASPYGNEIALITEEGRYIRDFSGHSERVTALSFSPNGKILASASRDKTIKLWQVSATARFQQGNGIQKVQFSRDSQTIATMHSGKTIHLLDNQGNLKRILNGDGSIFSFSPEGQSVVTGSAEDVIKLWSLGGQAIILKGHSNGITQASISPNGKTVVSIGTDDTLKFWRNDGRLVKTQTQPDTKISSLEFSPDSELVALSEENQVQLWHSDGTHIGDLRGHTSQIKTVRFSPDSELIATAGDDNLINLWRKNGTPINVLTGHTEEIRSINFSSNSQVLASVSQSRDTSRGAIKLWNHDGNLIKTLDGRGIREVHFSPDNRTIAAINEDKTIQLWDITGKQIATLSHNGKVTNLSFSPDGELLASASADNTIRLWHQDGTLIKTLRGHADAVSQVMFSPVDGQTIVSVSKDGMVQLWRRDGTKLKMLQPAEADEDRDSNQGDNGNHIEFSKDGKIIIFTGTIYSRKRKQSSHALKLWSHDGSQLKELQRQGNFNQITFSTDGKNIAWVDQDKSLKLWDLQGSLQTTFSGHQDAVNTVSFSPDGKLLASASNDHTVRLWTRNGQLLKQLEHTDNVNSVSFSADGKVLASASDDHTVKLWNHEGQFLKQLHHADKVTQVSFSPVSNILASASDDKTVKLWSQVGQALKSPLEHTAKVNGIKFSSDGKMLASTQGDTVKLWQISDSKELIKPVENSALAAFNPDSSLLATTSGGRIQFSMIHGIWDPRISLSIQDYLTDLQFSPDQTILATVGTKLSIVDFNLDHLLIKACSLARNYLQNNQKLQDRDRHLCDDIPTQK